MYCLFLHLNFPFLQNQVFSYNSPPYVMNIFDYCLEMRCCIIGTCDENIITLPGRYWRVERSDRNKPGQGLVIIYTMSGDEQTFHKWGQEG